MIRKFSFIILFFLVVFLFVSCVQPIVTYSLVVNPDGGGNVTIKPEKDKYEEGDNVQLTAVPDEGWQFDHWEGDLTGDVNPSYISMNSDKNITAVFTEIPPETYSLTVNTNGQGDVTVNPEKTEYEDGDNVQLTAVPDEGWQFDHWEGDITGDVNPSYITMNSDKNITAVFTETPPETYSLTINTDGQGDVTVNPEKVEYEDGDNVQLMAVPDEGWQFDHWEGDITGDVNPSNIIMNSDKNIIAVFTEIPPETYSLTINTNGQGNVTVNPEKAEYEDGDNVQLTAVPGEGWQFDHWEGNLTGDVNPSYISMNSDKNITAVFTEVPPETYSLTINTNGQGDVTVNPEKTEYEDGDNVQLTAVPDEGWQFDHWEGNLTGDVNPSYISMNSDKNITAVFTEIPPETYSLTINTDGQGDVTVNPEKIKYEDGDNVQLTAVPDEGWQFDHWEGDLTGDVNPSYITMNSDKNITAVFTEIPPETYSLTVNTNGQGDVTVNPEKVEYEDGDNVQLTAVPDEGWQFDHWEGDLTGDVNPSYITMNSDKNITAVFTEIPNIPPTIQKVSGPDGEVNEIDQTFQWTGSDSDGSISGYEYRKDGESWTNIADTQYIWNTISEGAHTFETRAKDDDGAYSEIITWSFTVIIYSGNVDLVGPVYNGNILLVSNESTNENDSQNVGTLPDIINNKNAGKTDGIYMVDAILPYDGDLNENNLVSPDDIDNEEYSVGDTKLFWTENFTTSPSHPEQINATLQYVGSNVEIWAEDTDDITSPRAQQLGEEFDGRIWNLVTTYFYTPSDVNGDGKVTILCFDIKDDFETTGTYYGGYFYSRDLWNVTYSNNMEIFYIDTYPAMHYPESSLVDVSKAYSILAHEFQHMVNYNINKIVEHGDSMPSWLNEAFSMAAEHMYEGAQSSRINYYNSSSSIRNGHSLLKWGDNGDTLANYSLSYLMGQYIRTQMNQGDNIFKEMLEDLNNDYRCVENAVKEHIDPGMNFGDFMTSFRIALYLKESTGLYGFNGESGFDSLNTQIASSLPSTIRGGEAFFTEIDGGSFTESGNQGSDIQYAGIN
jgi:hypothetical protein